MEARYDLYGELAIPSPGSLGPALTQEQPATEELWRRIDDLDFHIRRQLARRTSKSGEQNPLGNDDLLVCAAG